MQIRLSGPVAMTVSGKVTTVGPPQRAAVLAALATDAGLHVPTETLIERVWGEAAPPLARRALHAHLTQIRHLLQQCDVRSDAVASVPRRTGGYRLDIDPDRIDLHRFRRLVDDARQPGVSDHDQIRLLGEAIGLWRGEPLAGVAGEWAARTRQGWRRDYHDAVLTWARVHLRTGDPTPTIQLLVESVADDPFHEPTIDLLMRALYASGRGVEALDVYTATRTRLVEELGIEPGPDLRRVQQAILRGDLDLDVPAVVTTRPAPPTAAVAAAAARAAPAQLPHDVRGFCGRAEHLARLDVILAAGAGPDAPVVISALAGTAGVGKTSLAVHWAHRVRDRFPDGQLHLNLRGFDPDGSIVDPASAVRRFLDALGVPAPRIPDDPEDQAALYRSELSGKRMLILLDNARDTAQVRPLLPGAPGCLVLVTSRAVLTGLGATDSAHLITLDLLTVDEARDLLAARLDPDRVAAEPDAVDEIIAHCARLPLALSIVAARASAHPNLSLRSLAEALRDARHRLDTLSTDDPATDVRAAFSWSYWALTPAAARLFRLLSHHPGGDIGRAAAASLAALPPAAVSGPLAELAHAQLITERDSGRYSMHDLLREYAAELSHGTDTPEQDLDAPGRVMDHYLHTGYAAALLLEPTRNPITLDPPRDGVTVQQLADHDEALAWFTAEYPTLLAVIDTATRANLDGYVWRTVWTMTQFLDRKGLWRDRISLGQAALGAAGRLADVDAHAWAHFSLGVAYLRVNRLADAQTHLGDSLELYRRIGDPLGQARVLMPLSYAAHRQGDHTLAVTHARQGLVHYRAVGDLAMQGRSLSNLAWLYTHLGDYRQALDAGRQASDISRDLHDRQGLANSRDTLGLIHHKLGQHDLAMDSYRQALDLYQELGLRYHEAETLTRVGDTYHALGDVDAARDTWQTVLSIFVELDHPDADQIRRKLTDLGPPA